MQEISMIFFLEKFEACYNTFFFDNIAEATYRVINDGNETMWHFKMYEDDFDNRTCVLCDETAEVFMFDKQIDYKNSSEILRAIEIAARNMIY